MSYCINPKCPQPDDPANISNHICRNCGSTLIIQGRYQVMRLLSDYSGFGEIYEAYSGATPKILKVLKQSHNSNSRVIELFQQEAAVLSQLNHPGIPKVEPDGYFQFFPRNGKEPVHCIIMEKIDGLNLRQWMIQQGNQPITEQQALNWLRQLAEILHLVHQKNYFHRDIKPENIMLRSTGQLVLIDFGTVRELTYTYLAQVDGAGSLTRISSAGYTPPEQEKGHAIPQSDFYALGRTFVYLLTGKLATDQVIYDPLNDKFNWRQYTLNISSKLLKLIDDLMANAAAERPKNTQEILEQLAYLEKNDSHIPPATYIEQKTLIEKDQNISKVKTIFALANKQWLMASVVALFMGLGGYGTWQVTQQCLFNICQSEKISSSKTLTGHSSFINHLVISPDGQTLFSASADKTIKLWNLATGKEIRTLTGHSSFINHLAISPDGQALVSASADKTIKLWDLATGKETNTLTGHSSFVNYLTITPDGQTLVSASADKTIKLWDLPTGKEILTLTSHSNYVNYLAISLDGQTLVSASADKTIKLWDLPTGKEILTLTGHNQPIDEFAVSSDWQTIATGSHDKIIKVWNLVTGKVIHTLTGHSGSVNFVVFSSDGQTLASGSDDKTIKLWNMATGEEIRTLTGHSSLVNYLTISPDGQTLVSASADQTIKLWNLATGEEIRTLTSHSGFVNYLTISPNGQTLVSSSVDYTIKIWNLCMDTIYCTGDS